MSNENMLKAVEEISKVVDVELSEEQKNALSDVVGDLVESWLVEPVVAEFPATSIRDEGGERDPTFR